MKRTIALSTLLLPAMLLAACSGLAPAETQATNFKNSQTGEVASGCGPMQGFKGAIDEARKGCDQAWQAKGWIPLNSAIAQAPE
ncbi:MAG TPA: hypothetical protein VHX19_05740 [Stellaceae bacterium]|jgi:hypothetical protein|nr:hypothetical protein [Stellaceae bacterium]